MEKQKINIKINKINGKTFLVYEVSPEIEKRYNTGSVEIKTSESWEGLKFYYNPEITQSNTYLNLLSKYRLFDDFGCAFYRNTYLNVAWLRTVGGRGKVEIKQNISFAELSILLKNTLSFVKEYFEEYLRDYEVKGSLTIEI